MLYLKLSQQKYKVTESQIMNDGKGAGLSSAKVAMHNFTGNERIKICSGLLMIGSIFINEEKTIPTPIEPRELEDF